MSMLCTGLFLFKRSELCFAGNETVEHTGNTEYHPKQAQKLLGGCCHCTIDS